jgi:hypothetical protein
VDTALLPGVDWKSLRLKCDAVSEGDMLYTSAYIATKQALWVPLVGRYEAYCQIPIAHSVWPCFWMDAGGTSGNGFEVDVVEPLTAQTPGRAGVVLHSTNHYGDNLHSVFPSSHTYHVTPAGGAKWNGPNPGSTRYGKAHDLANPATPDVQPWVKYSMEVDKLFGAAGYTIRIRIYWNDILILTYVDPFNKDTGVGPKKVNGSLNMTAHVGDKPVWVQSRLDAGVTEDKFWDIRFDSWVGGAGVGDAVTDANTRILNYDGKLQGGVAPATDGVRPSGAPIADVPSAGTRFPLYMNVGWIQCLTKNP